MGSVDGFLMLLIWEFKFMGIRQFFLILMAMLLNLTAMSEEIVRGVERVPERQMAMLFVPIVIPDLISVKAAFEYRLHPKLNLVVPLEAKWMDYRRAIRLGAKLFN